MWRPLPRDPPRRPGLGTRLMSREFKPRARVIAASGPGSSPDAESDAEFRCRVEKMRQLGGDRWLRMYEEIQSEDKQVGRSRSTLCNTALINVMCAKSPYVTLIIVTSPHRWLTEPLVSRAREFHNEAKPVEVLDAQRTTVRCLLSSVFCVCTRLVGSLGCSVITRSLSCRIAAARTRTQAGRSYNSSRCAFVLNPRGAAVAQTTSPGPRCVTRVGSGAEVRDSGWVGSQGA